MKFVDKIHSLYLVPKARNHILKVMKLLQHNSYEHVINNNQIKAPSLTKLEIIVKSYFWASRLIKKDLCLPRSVALYQQLKAAGYAVEHKFGVNKKDQKLAAHAWVEFQKQPLNESPDLKGNFKVLEKP